MLHPTDPVKRRLHGSPGPARVPDDPASTQGHGDLSRPLCVMADGTLFHADPAREAWIDWLRQQPLALCDLQADGQPLLMVHAGVLPASS